MARREDSLGPTKKSVVTKSNGLSNQPAQKDHREKKKKKKE